MNLKELKFEIYHPGEPGAGIRSYSETITMFIHSGDPGGEDGEFAEEMRKFLAEWFDSAGVSIKHEDKCIECGEGIAHKEGCPNFFSLI